MKRIIYLLLLFPFICFGQVPQSMSYQAMATNSEGFEIANSQISVQISIIEETPSGLVSFVEEHTVTTDAYGMFSINIGQGNTEDDYTAVDWSKSNFLKVELDDNMDGAYSLMGVSAFNSVPYSYMAENVMNPEELKDNLGDHTATQTLDMDSNYVSQVLAPELPLDAANKQYVDDMIGDITTGAGEIIHFNFTDGNYSTFTDLDGGERILVCVVPENKIRVFKNEFIRVKINAQNQYEEYNRISPKIWRTSAQSFFWGLENSSSRGSNEDITIGFPGDTIVLEGLYLYEDEILVSVEGFCYQYIVSVTQIDVNTTSYSMVSLDDGGPSSEGIITEGTGSSSSQGGYMISEESSDNMDLAAAMSYCRTLEQDGYNDWYLPTFDEFINIYSGKVFLDNLSNDLDSYDGGYYWSSSPYFGDNCCYYLIFNPILHNYDYNPPTNTRPFICIRKN